MNTEEMILVKVKDRIAFFNGLQPTRRNSLDNVSPKTPKKVDLRDIEATIEDLKRELSNYREYKQENHQNIQSSTFSVIVKLVRINDEASEEKRRLLIKEANLILKQLNERLPGDEIDSSEKITLQSSNNELEKKLYEVEKKINQYKNFNKENHEQYESELDALENEAQNRTLSEFVRSKILRRVSVLNNKLNNKKPSNSFENGLAQLQGKLETQSVPNKASLLIKAFNKISNQNKPELKEDPGINNESKNNKEDSVNNKEDSVNNNNDPEINENLVFKVTVKDLRKLFENKIDTTIPYTSQYLSQNRLKKLRKTKSYANLKDADEEDELD